MRSAICCSRRARRAVALGTMGLLAGDAGGDGNLRDGGLQRQPPDEGAGHPCSLGARAKHEMSAAVGRPIVLLVVGSLAGLPLGVIASRLLGHIVYHGESAGSRRRQAARC